MNLLEHYIKEIHNVKKYESPRIKQYEKSFVKVDITINCYGISRIQTVFLADEWEKIKKQGYYMG